MVDVWTRVPKPTESSVVTSVVVQGTDAQPFGLLVAITSVMASGVPTTSVTGTSVVTGWAEVAKPTSSVWTLVGKPTT